MIIVIIQGTLAKLKSILHGGDKALMTRLPSSATFIFRYCEGKEMINTSMRIIINGETQNCSDEFMNCLNHNLRMSFACYYKQRVHKMAKVNRLRCLQRIIEETLSIVQNSLSNTEVYGWITEIAGFYFLCVHYKIGPLPPSKLLIKITIANKVTSLKENCIETIGLYTSYKEEPEIRNLPLPVTIIETLLEYKEKEQNINDIIYNVLSSTFVPGAAGQREEEILEEEEILQAITASRVRSEWTDMADST